MTINRNQGRRRLRKLTGTLRFARLGALAALTGTALAAGGCTSTSTIDTAFSDIVPPAGTATSAPDASALALSDPAPNSGPRNTGTVPNIHDEPVARLQPGADNAALLAEMQALAAAHAAGRISSDAYLARMAVLQQLAATHSAKTLRQIEGE